jgi:hypothetical protein
MERLTRYFPTDYIDARRRFMDFARARGAQLQAYPISSKGPNGDVLSIDTAYLGPAQPRRLLIVCSGTHGVEGFYGSALQQRWLDAHDPTMHTANTGCLLIHAVNPFGFAWRRRTNEHNVDLNRNALARFPGPANPGYAQLNDWLNPASTPGGVDLFWPMSAWHLLRQGWATVKQAIAGGQYEFPQGIFYGGREIEESTAHVAEILKAPAFAAVERVVAIDIHTGLGRHADYRLLVDFAEGSAPYRELGDWFGAEKISGNRPERSIAYRVSGGLTGLIGRSFPGARQYPAVLEFGTVSLGRMIATLRRENRAYFHAERESDNYRRARGALVEVFCPPSEHWRQRVLERGERVLRQAQQALARV